MILSAAKAFNGFILEAKNAFDRVFNREVTEEELEQIKATFSVDEIKRYRAEFDAELLANYKEYNDIELLYVYIRMNFEPSQISKLMPLNTAILQRGWEVNYLIHLNKTLTEQLHYIKSLLETKEEEYYYEPEDMYIENTIYPHLIDFCKKLIKTEQAIPESGVTEFSTEVLNTPDYVWKSSATDLLELVTALYQNKSIERKDGKPLTRKELTAYFEQMFNIVIADTEGKLYKATNRKINQTPFLNNLAVQFENYAAGKDAKMLKKR